MSPLKCNFVYLYPLIQFLIQKPVLDVSVECVSPLSVNDMVLCGSVSCNPILDQKSVITHTHVIIHVMTHTHGSSVLSTSLVRHWRVITEGRACMRSLRPTRVFLKTYSVFVLLDLSIIRSLGQHNCLTFLMLMYSFA